MIEIVVNGEKRSVPPDLTIAGLLQHLEIDPSRVAVELDREIVPKTAWPARTVQGGASVEVVMFVGGG